MYFHFNGLGFFKVATIRDCRKCEKYLLVEVYNGWEAGAHDLKAEAEAIEFVQPGEKKAESRDLISVLTRDWVV